MLSAQYIAILLATHLFIQIELKFLWIFWTIRRATVWKRIKEIWPVINKKIIIAI